MMTVIIGGSGSGKSAFAEQYIEKIAREQKKYYIATMKVSDEEGRRKVERHRMQRAGKGFQTIEKSVDIEQAVREIAENPAAVLLECMWNLVANEMFSSGMPRQKDTVVQKVVEGIKRLKEQAEQLVIVTNNVFEDGMEYDSMTVEYMRALGEINQYLTAMSENVLEVVVGIPVVLKGES